MYPGILYTILLCLKKESCIMPMYAYRCRECESEFEVRQRFTDDPLTSCQICHADDAIYRVIQPAGVVFKGSGFYVTDTRSKKGTAKPASKTADNGNGDESKSTASKTAGTGGSETASSNTATAAAAPAGD